MALRKRQETEVANIKMLTFSLAVTRMDRIRNETSEGQCMLDVLERKSEIRLRWFGHVQRKNLCFL